MEEAVKYVLATLYALALCWPAYAESEGIVARRRAPRRAQPAAKPVARPAVPVREPLPAPAAKPQTPAKPVAAAGRC